MRVRSKHVLGVLLALLLVGVAHSPILGAGFVAQDWAALEPQGLSKTPAEISGRSPGARPLAREVLRVSRALCQVFPAERRAEAAPLLRSLNLLLYLACAPFLFVYARRLLRPWCGDEQARAAALAGTLIFCVHPLAPVVAAAVAAQGELAGALLALSSLALFLAGRQERVLAKTVASLGLCALAGFTAELARLLPLALAASEFLSAHRHRPLRVRLRTAATTIVVFGAAVSLDFIPGLLRHGSSALPAGLAEPFSLAIRQELGIWLVSATEKLGLLVLPANPLSLGVAGSALAGAVFLLVVQPALVGARSAPRLWGWILLTWFGALLVSLGLHPTLRIFPERFFLARSLLASIVPLSLGLGLAATALAGMRRWYITWIAAIGYAIVAHGNARPWVDASRASETLRAELVAARELHGTAPIFVIDPPRTVRGVESVGLDLSPLLHPWIEGKGPEGGAIRSSQRRAFLELLCEPEGARWVAERSVVIHPDRPGSAETPYRTVQLQRGPPSGAPRTWRGSLASPPLDWEPLEIGALRVTTQVDADLLALRNVGWRTRRAEAPDRNSQPGAWLSNGTEAIGLFDLASSLEWRLGGRVRSVFFQEGTQSIGTAEALEDLPLLGEFLPQEEGDAWVFPEPRPTPDLPGKGRGAYVVGILDVVSLEWREFPVVIEGGRLRAAGVVPFARPRTGRVAWRLEYRVGDLALARSRGRA